MGKKAKTAIQPTRAENYPEWYQQVIRAADLADGGGSGLGAHAGGQVHAMLPAEALKNQREMPAYPSAEQEGADGNACGVLPVRVDGNEDDTFAPPCHFNPFGPLRWVTPAGGDLFTVLGGTELAVVNTVQQGLGAELDMQAIYDLVGDKLVEIFNAGDADTVDGIHRIWGIWIHHFFQFYLGFIG